MMPALAMASLPPLPGLAQLGPARPAAAEEVDLFPAFKGAEDGDWQVSCWPLKRTHCCWTS
jgi:hypothetical protein